MTDLSFSFPPAMLSWLEQRVAQGDFVDVGDYLRDLIRREQQAGEDDAAWVRAMVAEGRASGFIEADPADLIEEIIAEISASDA
ncbi:MAG: type II toxin-antitoxin system ParD family antitoxin [Novosphingobium sp.]|nr:type II toxin-antitoxin system ParD family antitoxin [Novosphingobium sp.]